MEKIDNRSKLDKLVDSIVPGKGEDVFPRNYEMTEHKKEVARKLREKAR